MSSNFTGNANNFLNTDYYIPEEISEKDLKLRQYLNDISRATNSKDSGIYDAVETVTGQRFLPTFGTQEASNATYRSVLRKVIDTGALPNATSKSVAHGITLNTSFSVTRIYGAATNPTNSFIPIPFASPVLANNISLEMNGTDIVIITGSDRTTYTRSFVIVEWTTTI